MSRPNKEKIPTNAPPGGGLFNPFAGLELGGLTTPETIATAKTPETLDSSASVGDEAGTDADEKSPRSIKNTANIEPGRVVLRREHAHRGGKWVVVVDGFGPALDADFIRLLGQRLRQKCGCGGTVKGRTLELQGDHAAQVRAALEAEGFQVAGER